MLFSGLEWHGLSDSDWSQLSDIRFGGDEDYIKLFENSLVGDVYPNYTHAVVGDNLEEFKLREKEIIKIALSDPSYDFKREFSGMGLVFGEIDEMDRRHIVKLMCQALFDEEYKDD